MGQTIIHKNGKFNIYCSVMEKPVFKNGVSEFDVETYLVAKERLEIVERIRQATKNGSEGACRTQFNRDIEAVISCNNAGENDEHLSPEEFINKFLT